MARYSSDHKEKTRSRLLEAARKEFRLRGFDTSSIDTLMKAAGLTRGAFYAHFPSKEALVREVLSRPSGLVQRLAELGEEETREGATRILETYLDPQLRDDRVVCPMVAHAMDARRGGPDRAELYGQQVRALMTQLEVVVADDQDPTDSAAALTVLAVGAAILGAAVGDDDLASRLESAALAEIRRRLA